MKEQIRRIEKAVNAMEMRTETAVSCISGQTELTVYFKNDIFCIPHSRRDEIEELIEEKHCFDFGFVGITHDPDNLRNTLIAGAELIETQQEDWRSWAREVGAGELQRNDVLQVLALSAVGFMKK
jgi:hypothetical protein